MNPSGREPGVLCFGTFELDLATGEMRKGCTSIKLQSQQFQLLAQLVRRFFCLSPHLF